MDNLPFEQEDILYKVLFNSPAKTAINGSIVKGNIIDYTKENIAIKSLLLGSGGIQRGKANVNIHVPDISVSANGTTIKQPNNVRLKAIGTVVLTALNSSNHGADYNYWVNEESGYSIFKDQEGIDNHFLNIKIEFKFHNSNK